MWPVPTQRNLAVELIAGIGLVAVLAARSDLDDFSVVLPAAVVVGAVSLLAFATRSRPLFWCGVVGVVSGVTLLPRPWMCILFRPGTDPGERALIWAQSIGEAYFRYALLGGGLGTAVGYGASCILRQRREQRQKAAKKSTTARVE
jgi:hypothetical protein